MCSYNSNMVQSNKYLEEYQHVSGQESGSKLAKNIQKRAFLKQNNKSNNSNNKNNNSNNKNNNNNNNKGITPVSKATVPTIAGGSKITATGGSKTARLKGKRAKEKEETKLEVFCFQLDKTQQIN